MRKLGLPIWIALALIVLAESLTTDPAEAADADLTRQTGWFNVPIGGRDFKLAVHIFRPPGSGPFPFGESAIVETAAHLPDIDAKRIIVVGQSAGGLGAIALGDAPPAGVVGIISFADGRGGDDHEHICSGAERLAQAARTFGQANQVPQLWMYAANDHFFPPKVAHMMFDAYQAGSKPALRFADLPPFDGDGHKTLGYADPSVWATPVSTFLTGVNR